MRPWHLGVPSIHLKPEGPRCQWPSRSSTNLARELAGEAWDFERRHLVAQAYVRREAARAVMEQANVIQREDAVFEEP